MVSKIFRFLFIIITIIFVSLACNLPSNSTQNSAPKIPQVTVDPEQVLKQAVKVDPNSNTITVTLTETQINGLVFTQLQQLSSSNQIPVSEPNVKLQNGMITINGKIASGMISTNFSISLKPSVTSDHKIKLEVVKSDFGMLPVPSDFTKTIAEQFSASVNQAIMQSDGQISIDTVTITDGQLVVTAHR